MDYVILLCARLSDTRAFYLQTMKFPLSGYESLDYRYQDPWGYLALFSVSIGAQGMVIGTMMQRLNDGGDHSNSK